MVPQNIKPVLQRTAIEVSLAPAWGVRRQPGPFPSLPCLPWGLGGGRGRWGTIDILIAAVGLLLGSQARQRPQVP